MNSKQAPVLEIKNLRVNRGGEFNLFIDHLDLIQGEVVIDDPSPEAKNSLKGKPISVTTVIDPMLLL